jgi:hypothetical protein
MFSTYFSENQPDGTLITCDVAKWSKSLPPDRVHQVMVYPHTEYIELNHGGINIYHKDFKDHVETSLEENIALVRAKMDELKIDMFDLTFVDGDHEATSFRKDLRTAIALTKPDGYLVIDDIVDPNHCQKEVYATLRGLNDFYEYDNWSPVPGIALIKTKDLVLDK